MNFHTSFLFLLYVSILFSFLLYYILSFFSCWLNNKTYNMKRTNQIYVDLIYRNRIYLDGITYKFKKCLYYIYKRISNRNRIPTNNELTKGGNLREGRRLVTNIFSLFFILDFSFLISLRFGLPRVAGTISNPNSQFPISLSIVIFNSVHTHISLLYTTLASI